MSVKYFPSLRQLIGDGKFDIVNDNAKSHQSTSDSFDIPALRPYSSLEKVNKMQRSFRNAKTASEMTDVKQLFGSGNQITPQTSHEYLSSILDVQNSLESNHEEARSTAQLSEIIYNPKRFLVAKKKRDDLACRWNEEIYVPIEEDATTGTQDHYILHTRLQTEKIQFDLLPVRGDNHKQSCDRRKNWLLYSQEAELTSSINVLSFRQKIIDSAPIKPERMKSFE
jgi:hypothetical protein